MRFNNTNLPAVAATSMSHSRVLDSSQMFKGSFQAIFSLANTGSLTIEASNEQIDPVSFSVISTTAVTGATAVIVPAIDICYRWIRITYTPSAGAGTVSINCELFGF